MQEARVNFSLAASQTALYSMLDTKLDDSFARLHVRGRHHCRDPRHLRLAVAAATATARHRRYRVSTAGPGDVGPCRLPAACPAPGVCNALCRRRLRRRLLYLV